MRWYQDFYRIKTIWVIHVHDICNISRSKRTHAREYEWNAAHPDDIPGCRPSPSLCQELRKVLEAFADLGLDHLLRHPEDHVSCALMRDVRDLNSMVFDGSIQRSWNCSSAQPKSWGRCWRPTLPSSCSRGVTSDPGTLRGSGLWRCLQWSLQVGGLQLHRFRTQLSSCRIEVSHWFHRCRNSESSWISWDSWRLSSKPPLGRSILNFLGIHKYNFPDLQDLPDLPIRISYLYHFFLENRGHITCQSSARVRELFEKHGLGDAFKASWAGDGAVKEETQPFFLHTICFYIMLQTWLNNEWLYDYYMIIIWLLYDYYMIIIWLYIYNSRW